MPVFDLSQCETLHTAHLRGYISNPIEARTVLSQMINTVTCTPTETQAVILEFFARPQDFHILYETTGWVIVMRCPTETALMYIRQARTLGTVGPTALWPF